MEKVWKVLRYVSIKVSQIMFFVKGHQNLARKIRKGQAIMEQGICQFWISSKEIEYFNKTR
jgi:hypothetical protein